MSAEWKSWGVAAIVIVIVLVAAVVVGVVMAMDYKKKHVCVLKVTAAAVAQENISAQNAKAIADAALAAYVVAQENGAVARGERLWP